MAMKYVVQHKLDDLIQIGMYFKWLAPKSIYIIIGISVYAVPRIKAILWEGLLITFLALCISLIIGNLWKLILNEATIRQPHRQALIACVAGG